MGEAALSSSIEAEFARRLAGNDKRSRDKALKKLKQFLNLRSAKTDGGFTRVEMLCLWKGLFYCMWMSDKPLVQEELAETISDLLISVSNTKTAMLFLDTFLETMQREWRGIDRLRMDKFYLLVRCMLRKGFEFLKQQEWDKGVVDWMLAILKNGPISATKPVLGMQYHMSDIYLEELSKVCKDTLDAEMLMTFLDPYCLLVAKTKNEDLVRSVIENIFHELVENSKPALDLLAQEEYLINVKGHTQTESVDSSPIAQLNVNYSAIADRLFELASSDKVLGRNRKEIFKLVEKFRELSKGRLPVSDMPDAEYSSEDEVKGLEENLTKSMVSESDKDVRDKRDYRKTKKRKNKSQSFNSMDLDVLDNVASEHDDSGLADVSEEPEDIVETVEEVGTMQEKASKKKSKKKRKKTLKSESDTVIIGSAIEEKSTTNDAHSSDQDMDSTVLELTPKIKNLKEKNVELNKNTSSENMPDILQDIPRCKEAAEKKLKRKRRAESLELLKEWLATGEDLKKDKISIEPKNTENGLEKPKRRKKKGKIGSNDQQNESAENVEIEQPVKIVKKKHKKKGKRINADVLNREKSESVSSDVTKSENIVMKTEEIASNKQKQKTKNDSDDIIIVGNSKKKQEKSKDQFGTEQNNFATITSINTLPATSTFFKVAASKVDKAKKNKHLAATKRKPGPPVAAHSPKRVVFEMSKTQIQPFRKMDKSSAVSPSPNNIAFDPRKTPDFGLLKRNIKQAKKKRQSASDFF